MKFRPRQELLSCSEFKRLITRFHKMGFDKFRFTGGEPTLHPDLVELVRFTRSLSPSPFVALTTNAYLLAKQARALADAGLQRVNISLDSMQPDRFLQLARRGSLDKVLEGISAAEEAGLEVKINTVVVQNFNEDEVVSLAALTLKHPWQIRFLEMMPFGKNSDLQLQARVNTPALQSKIHAELGPLHPVGEGLDGEARVFRLQDAPGTIGFISPVSAPFCASCNRVRLTADGKLKLCLLKDGELDLREILRGEHPDEEIDRQILAGVARKPWGHDLSHNRFGTLRGMSEIGG